MGPEKLLPHNTEAEEGLLGSILIDPEALLDVMDLLAAEDFYREAHRQAFQAAVDLFQEKATPADAITLEDELRRRGQQDAAEALGPLPYRVPTSLNAVHYARIVERTAVLRRLIQAAGQIAGVAYNQPDADVAIEQAERLFTDAILRRASQDSAGVGQVLDAFLHECLSAIEAERLPGVTSGFPKLDEHLLGFRPGELIYVCGRPSSGKSVLVGSVAVHAALEGHQVEWISLEMTAVQLIKRVVSSWAGIDGRVIRAGFRHAETGQVDKAAYHQTRDGANAVRAALDSRLRLLDRPLKFAEVRQHLTRAVLKRGCSLAVIDYLGLLGTDDVKASEYKRISDMSMQLKALALALQIPIICAVQLNRDCEERQNKRPTLPDLRGSGSLEQDADMVLGLYRGAYYYPRKAERDSVFAQLAELLVLKVRDGIPNVTVPLRFQGEHARMSNWPADLRWQHYWQVRSDVDEAEGGMAS